MRLKFENKLSMVYLSQYCFSGILSCAFAEMLIINYLKILNMYIEITLSLH